MRIVAGSGAAIVFVVAVAGKVRSRQDWNAFRAGLVSQPINATTATLLALAVIVGEGSGLAFAVGGLENSRLLVGPAAVLASLTIGLMFVVRVPAGESCKCFGRLETGTKRGHIGANLMLIAVLLVGAADVWSPRTLGDLVCQIALGIVFAGLGVYGGRAFEMLVGQPITDVARRSAAIHRSTHGPHS